MIRAVLFDLDDTLYCEADFVRSGFIAVAEALELRGVGRKLELLALLEYIHAMEGRERVLDKLTARLGLPEGWAPELVECFRAHQPSLELASDVVEVLTRLRERYQLGCVTDGWGATQRRKVEVLKLASLLDVVVFSDDFGRAHWKPSPRPFRACCALLGVTPAESVFVGDNPERDVRGARNAGLLSVRIRRERGYLRDFGFADDPAHFEIVRLEELEHVLEALRIGRSDVPLAPERGR